VGEDARIGVTQESKVPYPILLAGLDPVEGYLENEEHDEDSQGTE
jgi:hypothetical protein